MQYEMDWARAHGEYPEMDDETYVVFSGLFIFGCIVGIAILFTLCLCIGPVF
jgi:hypothetical protein